MLDEIKKPQAPPPPLACARPPPESADKSPNARMEKTVTSTEKTTENVVSRTSGIFEKSSTLEKVEKVDEKIEKSQLIGGEKSASSTLERRLHSFKQDKTEKIDKVEGTEALIAQLNSRVCLYLYFIVVLRQDILITF